jgi:diguanylate cyclase (GGDEF)-like protein
MDCKYGAGLTALVVDDEPSARVILQHLLEEAGFAVETVGSLVAASVRQSKHFDLIITDKNLPDGSGLEIVQWAIDTGQDCELVVMSAYANLESAMEAIRLRVADYLVKPFASLDDVQDRLRRAMEHLRLTRENEALIGELRTKNIRLEDLVVRDGLTGLYNHAHFQERLEGEVERSKRCNHEFGLLFIDLDNFKAVNDGVGHQVGDAVLKEIAAILGADRSGRPACGIREHDVAARYGGDEFVLLLPETNKSNAAVMGERLRLHIEQRGLGIEAARVTVSLGIAAYPADGSDRESLIRAADRALYVAKRLGRNRVIAYSRSMERADTAQVPDEELAAQVLALERSMTERLFSFVYQPIVETPSFRVIGYEALCRPHHPELRSVLDAVGVAENAGQMRRLGRVLRDLALTPARRLPQGSLLFVNLHPHELTDPQLQESLEEFEGSPIVFEIAETVALKDYEQAHGAVQRLRAQGYKIALDDLGAGYAGLNALAQLEADFVKLDRSLVHNIHRDRRTFRLIKHLLEYARNEGLVVVGEGVEEREDWLALVDLGCPLAQGFFICRPAPAFASVAAAPSVASVPCVTTPAHTNG